MQKEYRIDLLFRVKFIARDDHLYIIVEHQSKPEKWMPLRINKYVALIIDRYLHKKIPAIYRIVIYNGRKKYPYSLDLAELVGAPLELAKELSSQHTQLIDLGQIDDEQLKQNQNIGVLEFVLKHTYEKDMLPFLQEIIDKLKRLTQIGYDNYLSTVLKYAMDRGEIKNRQAFYKLVATRISTEIGGTLMTLSEQLRYEGRQEGRQEGLQSGRLEAKLEVAERLLAEGVELSTIARVTGLSPEIIIERFMSADA